MTQSKSSGLDRRTFLRAGSLGTLGMLLGGMNSVAEIRAPSSAENGYGDEDEDPGRTVSCAVIGAGPRGRELLETLTRLRGVRVVSVCDTYEPFRRRAKRLVDDADTFQDYRSILEDRQVEAVFVATPSHQHRNIAIEALEAGKHVYCEAPLAADIDDARAIARAARDAGNKRIFQVGQQYRAEPQHHHVRQFVRAGALGQTLFARSHWSRRESWRRAAPTRERENEINWRLSRETSPGLIGEVGIHALDVASWFLDSRPTAITGRSGLLYWNDGRDVPDTVNALLEYPNGVNLTFEATLANSYQGIGDVICGSDSAILMQENRAWMFREADAPLLGWEVYARREQFFEKTGISLVADATQLLQDGLDPATDAPEPEPSVYYALKDFFACIREGRTPYADYQTGFEAAVTAIKTNQAVLEQSTIAFKDEWYTL